MPLLPRFVHEQPPGDSSHEHVIVAWRGKVVRIRPGKKFRAESKKSESSACSKRDELGCSGRLEADWNTSMAKDLPRSPNS